MSEILTAEEFIKKHYEKNVKNHFLNFNKESSETYQEYAKRNPLKTLEESFIEFAKLHVQAALKTAHRNMQLPDEDLEFTLDCYPIENIK